MIAEASNSDKPSRFTIRDVAQMAGVSTATVSNVVNNTGKVSRATRERVRAAIESMNWKPDKNARNLAKKSEGSMAENGPDAATTKIPKQD